jgi:hypothetical protein
MSVDITVVEIVRRKDEICELSANTVTFISGLPILTSLSLPNGTYLYS